MASVRPRLASAGDHAPATWAKAATAAAIGAWFYYFLIQKLPITADEAFFAHVFWLLRQGQQQYVDFYEVHLPTYFHLLEPLLPKTGDLDFIWWLRGLSFVCLAAYAAMLRPALWPLMLMFAVFGRMVEIRPDTIGLLLFNAAWLLLLRDRSNAVLAAGIASLALLFSARAAVMMVPLALLCLYFERRRPWTLLALGAAYVGALGIVYALAPSWATLVVRSAYIDTLGFDLPLADRFLMPERAILLIMIFAALATALVRLRARSSDAALITIVATVAQLLLIAVIDPAPYEYAYGWALVPVLLGLPGSDKDKSIAALGFAGLIVAAAAIYPLVKDRPPRAGSFLVLTPEPPIGDVRSMRTEQLVPLLLERHALWNQLPVRAELCRRLDGPVLVGFWYHPICLPDASFHWFAFSWPQDFTRFRHNPPDLIIWGDAIKKPAKLPDDYDVYDGFAVREHRPEQLERPLGHRADPAVLR